MSKLTDMDDKTRNDGGGFPLADSVLEDDDDLRVVVAPKHIRIEWRGGQRA